MDTTLLDTPQDDNLLENAKSQLSHHGHSAILGSIGWMRFTAIILCLLGAILGIFTIWLFFYYYFTVSIFATDRSANILVVFGIFYASIAAAAIFSGVLLLRAIGSFSDFATFKEGSVLDKALHHTRMFWTALGVTIIVVVVVVFVTILSLFGMLAFQSDF